MSYTHIIVPLDGSPFSEQSLPVARTLARRLGAKIELVHAHMLTWPDPLAWMPYSPDLFESIERDALAADERYLRGLAARVGAAPGPPTSWTVITGQPLAAIEKLVRRTGADLVAMTTHGRGGIARAWLGSVADGLLRNLEVPLLLVRPGEAEAEANIEAEVPLARILVPLDGSALAEAAVAPAVQIARAVSGRLTLLSVVVPFFGPGSVAGASTVAHEFDVQPRIDLAHAYLAEVADHLRAESLEVDTHVGVHSYPATALLGFAEERGMELIALSTHGRGGLSRAVLGSVADKVIRGAQVPVLVLRAAE